MTFNTVNISCIEDLVYYSKLIERGVVKMPNISKLARSLNKNRRTIRKALSGIVPKKTRDKSSYLDEHRSLIVTLLTDKFKKFEYYQHLYNYLVREHQLECSYSSLKRYIQRDEELNKYFSSNSKKTSFTERFETAAGKQAQFDLKERIKIVDKQGVVSRIHVATLTFGFSRYNIRKVVPDTTYETVIAFLAEAFEEVGGVPKELVIDNIKCLVDKPRSKDKDAVLNVKFVEFAKDYNLSIKPCMPYRPETKGKTETQNKVPGQLMNYNGEYQDFHDAHRIIQIINDEDNDKLSQATGFPASFLLKNEKEELQTLPSTTIRSNYYLTLSEVAVTRDSLVSYKSCKYSVPKEYIGKKVGRRIKSNQLLLYYNNKIITIHQITTNKMNIKESHHLNYETRTKIPKKEEVKRLEEMENINYDNR